MADLSITAANVAKNYGGKRSVTAGETITAGQPVYINPTDSKAYKAKGDTLVHAAAKGIALGGASAGQSFDIQVGGQIAIGGTVAVGTVYVVSNAVAGNVAPIADLSTGAIVTVLGVGGVTASGQNILQLSILRSGQVHA